jgi:DNA-binding transcriptional ArsR family regulator
LTLPTLLDPPESAIRRRLAVAPASLGELTRYVAVRPSTVRAAVDDLRKQRIVYFVRRQHGRVEVRLVQPDWARVLRRMGGDLPWDEWERRMRVSDDLISERRAK